MLSLKPVSLHYIMLQPQTKPGEIKKKRNTQCRQLFIKKFLFADKMHKLRQHGVNLYGLLVANGSDIFYIVLLTSLNCNANKMRCLQGERIKVLTEKKYWKELMYKCKYWVQKICGT